MADDVAIKKRAQIAKANRTMLAWVAIASLVVGASVVVCYFLAKILIYGESVLAAKQDTESTLVKNLQAADGLKDEVRALDANEALASVKAQESDRVLQVVLDALPAEANSLALGASLQNKLLIPGGAGSVELELLQVEPVAGVETGLQDGDVADMAQEDGQVANSIGFQFSVKGSDAALKAILTNLERSIRVMDVTSIMITGESGGQTMVVTGRAYYEPAKSIKLVDKVVPRE